MFTVGLVEGCRSGEETVREVGEPGETRISQRKRGKQKGRAGNTACHREMEEGEG